MALKTFKPTTPGQRHKSVENFSDVSRKKPEKSLVKTLKSKAGRNNQGRITIRSRGGGVKRKYRMIDFNRSDKLGIPATVKEIEYDPNRNVRIGLAVYKDGEKRYILIPNKLKKGFTVVADEKALPQPGNRMRIKNIPVGIDIYNIETEPQKGGIMVRAAGTSAKLASLEGEYAQVRLPSGEVRYVNKECFATVGVLGNAEYANLVIGNAGRARKMGKRPSVRGKAMNPVDHPHGGGEGGTSIGLVNPKTPWGKPALGLKTRKNKFTDRWIARRRSRKNKK